MNKVLLSLLTLLVFSFLSCKKDVLTDEGTTDGNVKFNLKIANELDMFKLKSVNTDDFLISVMDQDSNLIIDKTKLGDIPNGIYLETGAYTAYAEYGDADQVFGWEKPVYFGETEFNVTNGVVSQVQLSVALTNTKVAVVYSDFLLQAFPDISVEVCSEEPDYCADYYQDSTRIGYFSGTEKFLVHVKPNSDSTYTHEITGVKPNMYYRLTFTASNQGADFDITIEEEDLIEIEYNVPIEPGMHLPGGDGGSSGNDTITGKTFTGDISLITQAAINNFASQNFVIVDGSVTLNGSSLTTEGLETIKEITGNIDISGTNNLTGLRNLLVVGGNVSYSGLHTVSTTNNLNKVGGSLTISGGSANRDCSFFNSLFEVSGNLTITFGTDLYSMKGFGNLNSIGGEFYLIPYITNSSASTGYDAYDRNFSEVSNIKEIGQLTIGAKSRTNNNYNYYSFQITSLSGLEKLETLDKFTVTIPKAQSYSRYYLYHVYSYCAISRDIWENMADADYSNSSQGYAPPISTLRQGICEQ